MSQNAIFLIDVDILGQFIIQKLFWENKTQPFLKISKVSFFWDTLYQAKVSKKTAINNLKELIGLFKFFISLLAFALKSDSEE